MGLYMKYEVSGEVVEMTRKGVWKSGKSETPVISLPRGYVDEENVTLTIIRKDDGSHAIVIE